MLDHLRQLRIRLAVRKFDRYLRLDSSERPLDLAPRHSLSDREGFAEEASRVGIFNQVCRELRQEHLQRRFTRGVKTHVVFTRLHSVGMPEKRSPHRETYPCDWRTTSELDADVITEVRGMDAVLRVDLGRLCLVVNEGTYSVLISPSTSPARAMNVTRLTFWINCHWHPGVTPASCMQNAVVIRTDDGSPVLFTHATTEAMSDFVRVLCLFKTTRDIILSSPPMKAHRALSPCGTFHDSSLARSQLYTIPSQSESSSDSDSDTDATSDTTSGRPPRRSVLAYLKEALHRHRSDKWSD